MPLGIFGRRRKVTSLVPAVREVETIILRVLVDSGPASGDMFVIRVGADDDVSAIRAAVASHIGIPSMCLFKVAIPWQAHYEASAYTTQFGAHASLLTCFPGWNLDDPSQLAASGGAAFPAYISGSGSLRARRRASTVFPGAVDVTVRHWFLEGGELDEINILVRTASTSSLDWARPACIPITLSARFTQDRRRRPGLDPLPINSFKAASDTTLVDISPDATIAELKLSLLLASGRPAPAGLLDSIVLWAVELTEPELEVIEANGGLSHGGRPYPYPPHSAPPLLLENPNVRVGDYLASFRSHRGDPRSINLSAWINPAAADALEPRFIAPRFQYPMPEVLPPPTRSQSRPFPTIALDSPMSTSAGISSSFSSSSFGSLAPPTPPSHRCCSTGHEGMGLVGLGIIMSPSASVSDHGSSDDEAFSWPPTPNVGGNDDEATWLGPSPTAPAWGHEDNMELERDLEHEQCQTPKGLHQTMIPFADSTYTLVL